MRNDDTTFAVYLSFGDWSLLMQFDNTELCDYRFYTDPRAHPSNTSSIATLAGIYSAAQQQVLIKGIIYYHVDHAATNARRSIQ